MDLDIEAYAQVMAELSAAGPARAEVLARRGLDEDRWEAIDTAWQARISAAIDEAEDGISPLLSAYAAAYEAAQSARSPPISLEQFAQATRLMQASGDVQAALARAGVTMADYVQGSQHWSRRIVEDPELERRFEAALRGR
ncbi:hypothetical protein [Sorangium sp. So ce1182]|uniref:hypothetical protein n=1 Tax=Sorangium sp. So ce1182 TaxID=3133334 RepID=UPI003F61C9C7